MKKLSFFLSIATILFVATSCTNNNQQSYVDLGLPSGTLWATCNVGADSPEACGDCFAWGETTSKDHYGWDNYRYSNGGDIHNSNITKYCNDPESGYNGFTDNLENLQPEDDAATANLGKEWKTPTLEQWHELSDKCTWTWCSNGYKIAGPNGNSIFLPCTISVKEITGEGSTDIDHGRYWSNTCIEGGGVFAYAYVFQSDFNGPSLDGRIFGAPVRPVRVSK